eukprot:m.25492 g.25492  ORF g.25492 m.25492 type:complete len:322 (-) comp8727_c1_seq1:81-1046(-)
MAERGGKRVTFSGEDQVRLINRKKPKHFEDEDDEDDEVDTRSKLETSEQHTMESDEESDDETQLNGRYSLSEEDMHEATDTEFKDGGVPLTGFNLDDEMEEGHFDADGEFHFHKDKSHEADAWLDGVDIYNPKQQSKGASASAAAAASDPPQSAQAEADEPIDRYALLENILAIMKPQETVAHTFQRFRPVQQRRKGSIQKKIGAKAESDVSDEQKKENKATLMMLIDATDKLIQDGLTGIHEYTYEQIAHEIKTKHVVTFVYRWTREDDAEIYGPFPASQMNEWKEAGLFGQGVWVREVKKGKRAAWYHSNRVDFDLYDE